MYVCISLSLSIYIYIYIHTCKNVPEELALTARDARTQYHQEPASVSTNNILIHRYIYIYIYTIIPYIIIYYCILVVTPGARVGIYQTKRMFTLILYIYIYIYMYVYICMLNICYFYTI